MKIYEIGTGYTPIPAQMGAATEIVVEELTRAFQKKNADVTLLDIQACDRKPNTLPIVEVPVLKYFSGTDVKLGLMHKLKRVVYSVSLANTLKRILQDSKEQIVLHFHNQYNLFFFLKLVSPKLRAKARIAYTVHSYIWPGEWSEIEATVKKRYFQEIFCVKNADYVLVLNKKTAAHFTRHLGVPKERIYMVGNGVNTDTYHALEKDAEELRKQLGFANQKIIFQVGSVCDRKNQLGVLTMLKEYLRAHTDTIYAYAGGVIDPEYQNTLLRFAQENGLQEQVRYLGELCPGEELNGYYNAATVTVFPSRIESFGLVIIESLAAQTPVILAERPLFPLDIGWNVYSSEDEFIRLVDACVHSSRKEQSARDAVIKYYSWDKIAEDHLAIWNK